MASHLRCLLFHGNGDFRGRVLSAIGRMLKTHNAISGAFSGIKQRLHDKVNMLQSF